MAWSGGRLTSRVSRSSTVPVPDKQMRRVSDCDLALVFMGRWDIGERDTFKPKFIALVQINPENCEATEI